MTVEGPRYGLRWWHWNPYSLCLTPTFFMHHKDVWRDGGGWSEAEDWQGPGGVPGPRNNVGLYSFATVPHTWDYGRLISGLYVVGVVELAGVVQVHEWGYRSQYARPVALGWSRRALPPPRIDATAPSRVALQRWCDEHGIMHLGVFRYQRFLRSILTKFENGTLVRAPGPLPPPPNRRRYSLHVRDGAEEYSP